MEEKIAVSVIVPAYNAEKTIRKCIESILSQKLNNIQIVAVDDGSKDDTRAILHEYRVADERIKIIEKDVNEGLSAARNSALKLVEGEYVSFVDSDDWIDKDHFYVLYNNSKNADIVVGGYQHDTMSTTRDKLYVSRIVNMPSAYYTDKAQIVREAAHIDSMKMFAFTCNKLYKRKLLQNSNLLFTNQVLIEDFIFNTKIWDDLTSLSIVESAGYHYVKASKDALSQKYLPDYLKIMMLRYDCMKGLLNRNGVFNGIAATQCANMHIKHITAGFVRLCSEKCSKSIMQKLVCIKHVFADERSIEAKKLAKAYTKQEKICNFMFKMNCSILELIFAKIIYLSQTRSKSLFDKIK